MNPVSVLASTVSTGATVRLPCTHVRQRSCCVLTHVEAPAHCKLQVFVAGATGNTGQRVVRQLSEKGYKVLAGVRVRRSQNCNTYNACAFLSYATPMQ